MATTSPTRRPRAKTASANRRPASPLLQNDRALTAAEFAPQGTWLNTATYGLAPASVVAAVTSAEVDRARGRLDVDGIEYSILRSRMLYADLIGTAADRVAIGSQVSVLVGQVAASVAPGTVVLGVDDDFTSVLWPFAARPDLELRCVPVAELVDNIVEGVGVVAVSAVQSSCGTALGVDEVTRATHLAGARLLLDVTQAAGWMPLAVDEADGGRGVDWVVCGGYKWLLGPRGAAWLSGMPDALDSVRPTGAGWWAGEDPWDSCYGPGLRLAGGARRLDVSPAWPVWLGQAAGLELITSIGLERIFDHNTSLATRFCEALDLQSGTATCIVSVEADDAAAERLRAAGVAFAHRNGRLRFAFHLYNTVEEVDLAASLLRARPPA